MPGMQTTTDTMTEETKSDDSSLSCNLIMLRSRGENLQFITKLNLWGLKLKDISMVKSMPNLKVVNMSANSLTTLEPFVNCFNLCELYVRNNQIVNIDEVAHLKYLHKLEKLWLSGNPCCHFFKSFEENDTTSTDSSIVYRCTVIRNLRCLIHLDQSGQQTNSSLDNESTFSDVLLTTMCLLPVIFRQELAKSNYHNNCNDGEESNSTHTVVDDITLSTDVEMKKLDIVAGKYSVTSVLFIQSDKKHIPDETLKNDNNNINNVLKEVKTINENKGLINASICSHSPCIKRKHQNRSCLQDVTLKETNKIRQEYGLKPINKNKISSPAKRIQSVDQKNEKIVRNSIIRLLKTLNCDSLERIIQAAEKRLLRLSGLTYNLQLQSFINGEIGEDNADDGEWTPNGTYDCSNYINGAK
uniref:Uncharacterized protein n=1 Tax=Trichobilharzia regenti TaxID=157069 RepID=A0AA85J042_TRIRE|nr:unnamed protein product [Trichobilharzia regenti]